MFQKKTLIYAETAQTRRRNTRSPSEAVRKKARPRFFFFFFLVTSSSALPHISASRVTQRGAHVRDYRSFFVHFGLTLKRKVPANARSQAGQSHVFRFLLVHSSRTSVETPARADQRTSSPCVTTHVEKINLGYFFFFFGTEKRGVRTH